MLDFIRCIKSSNFTLKTSSKMQENNQRISFRSTAAIDMNRRYENFRRSKNLSHLDFGRLMVSMYEYKSHINISQSIRAMLNGRMFSDKLLVRMYNVISKFQKLKDINKVIGKKRTGFNHSPVGCSVEKTQEKLSDNGSLGAHYLNRFIKKSRV